MLDAAEATLRAAKERHRIEDAAAKERVEAAQRDRRVGQERASAEERDLDATRQAEQRRYGEALERWRRG